MISATDLLLFRRVLLAVVAADQRHEALRDYASHEALLRQLWGSASEEDFSHFASIVASATDPDERSPK